MHSVVIVLGFIATMALSACGGNPNTNVRQTTAPDGTVAVDSTRDMDATNVMEDTHPDTPALVDGAGGETAPLSLVFEEGIQPADYNLGQLTLDTDPRYFWLILPEAFDPNKQYPLWIHFHGAMGSGTPPYYPTLANKNKLAAYRASGFIRVLASSYSAIKTAGNGAGGKWVWHKPERTSPMYAPAVQDRRRDDFKFIDQLIRALIAPTTSVTTNGQVPQPLSQVFTINPQQLFATGHSSGGNYLYSFVLGGPVDMPFKIMENYSFQAISISGANLREDIVDFSENTGSPQDLPSVLHIQGERDKALWFNGKESGQGAIDFKPCANPILLESKINADGLRETPEGWTYSAWHENEPQKPSTLKRWADAFGQQYQSSTGYQSHYMYRFASTTSGDAQTDNILLGIRLKDCGHGIQVDNDYRQDFFRSFFAPDYNFTHFLEDYEKDRLQPSGQAMYGCKKQQSVCPAP